MMPKYPSAHVPAARVTTDAVAFMKRKVTVFVVGAAYAHQASPVETALGAPTISMSLARNAKLPVPCGNSRGGTEKLDSAVVLAATAVAPTATVNIDGNAIDFAMFM
jgi:hypothetical protein